VKIRNDYIFSASGSRAAPTEIGWCEFLGDVLGQQRQWQNGRVHCEVERIANDCKKMNMSVEKKIPKIK
jgi:hypothetical protein